MPILRSLGADFKQAGLDIFDAMVDKAQLVQIAKPHKVDPVSGAYVEGECALTRGIIVEVPLSRRSGSNYEVGDCMAYMLYDEVPFEVTPGCEYRQALSADAFVVNPNVECPPEEGPIEGGDYTDQIHGGDASGGYPKTTTQNYRAYTVVAVSVDAAEAAYTLTLRLK